MVIELLVVDEPWPVRSCANLECNLSLSAPGLGHQRNWLPAICPKCGKWFCWRAGNTREFLGKVARSGVLPDWFAVLDRRRK